MVKIFNRTERGSSGTTGHFIDLDRTTGHGLDSDTQSIVDSVVEELKEILPQTQFVLSPSSVDQLIKEIRVYSECYLPIEESDLNEIYDNFVKPYVECEIYEIGSIVDVIRLNQILDEQIEAVDSERTKLILKILRDIMTVIVNARNDKISIVQYTNQISTLEEKYRTCNIEVIRLRRQVEALLNDEEVTYGVFKGNISVKTKNIKPFIYLQARIDIDRAWYQYLYPGCQIEPKKYQSTIAYVRSFGTLNNAYQTLVSLLDKKFVSYDDDLESASKLLAIEELKENEENS